jgi:hypothetical protein
MFTSTFGKFFLGKKVPIALEKIWHFKQYKSRFTDYLVIHRETTMVQELWETNHSTP